MSSAETQYTFWTPYPDVLQRGREVVVSMRVYRDGALVEPDDTGSSFSLIGPDGTAIVDEEDITVVGDIATYTLTAADLADTRRLGEGYQEVWKLVLPDGTTRTVDREAALALRPLSPAATDADLLGEYPDLNAIRGNAIASFQGFIDEAFRDTVTRLTEEGHLSYTVKSSWAFRVYQRELALGKFFRFCARNQPKGNYLDLAKTHEDKAESAWKRINFTSDDNHDGRVDDPSRRRGGHGSIVHINAAPYRSLRRDSRW